MNRNYRKTGFILLICAVLIIGLFALVTVVEKMTERADAKTTADVTADSSNRNASAAPAEKQAAEELIDQTVSKEKIQKNVGEWDKFEMDSNGCERGVYAGKFYYEEFTIYSRTYNKGKTFRVISVN